MKDRPLTRDTTAPISISINRKPDPGQVKSLFQQVDWAKGRTDLQIERLLENSEVIVTLYGNDVLLGFGRVVSDGACRALIDDVIVDKDHRGKGYGDMIMKKIMGEIRGIDEIFLNTGAHMQKFYSKYGFEMNPGLSMMKKGDAGPGGGDAF